MRGIPPTIEAVLSSRELTRSGDTITYDQIRRLARDPEFLRNLFTEAKKTEARFRYRPRVTDMEFALQPSGLMHPLSQFQCTRSECRRRSIGGFAQVAGLYADTTILTDQFSLSLTANADSDQPWTSEQAQTLAAHIASLRDLAPLIKSGAIQFGTPFRSLCPEHDKPTLEVINRTALESLELATDQMEVQFDEREVRVSSPLFVEGTTLVVPDSPAQIRRLKKLKTEWGLLHALLRRYGRAMLSHMEERTFLALLDCRNAAETGATIAATQPVELLVSKAIFSGTPRVRAAIDPTAADGLKLPWISNLTPAELVVLRERASKALPNFRLEVSRALRSTSPAELSTLADQLQREVGAVDAELRGALAKRARAMGPSAILMGLSMIVFGIGTKNPMLASGGAPLIAGGCSLWSSDKAARSEIERAQAKPAYVLLSARELTQKKH